MPPIRFTILALYKLVCMYVCMYDLMSDGSEFQVCGATTENASRANSVRKAYAAELE